MTTMVGEGEGDVGAVKIVLLGCAVVHGLNDRMEVDNKTPGIPPLPLLWASSSSSTCSDSQASWCSSARASMAASWC
jgi:hypothetical protein